MANYVSSSNIRMFPSAFRKEVTVEGEATTYNPDSHLNTEYNLTNLSARNTTTNGFVVSYNSETSEIEFCIVGYWFKANISEVKVSGSPLYATIQLKEPSTSDIEEVYDRQLVNFGNTGQTLENLDVNDGTFSGVYFSTPIPAGSNIYSVQLLDGTGAVPEASYLRLNTKNVADGSVVTGIDKQFTTDSVRTPSIQNKNSNGISIKSDAGEIVIDAYDSGNNQQGDVTILSDATHLNSNGSTLTLEDTATLESNTIGISSFNSVDISSRNINITNIQPSNTSNIIRIGDAGNSYSRVILSGGNVYLAGSGAANTGRIDVTKTGVDIGYGTGNANQPRITMSSSGTMTFKGSSVNLSNVASTTLGRTTLTGNVLVSGTNGTVNVGTSSNKINNLYATNLYFDALEGPLAVEFTDFVSRLSNAFSWYYTTTNTSLSSDWQTSEVIIPKENIPYTNVSTANLQSIIKSATIYFGCNGKNDGNVNPSACTLTVPLQNFIDDTLHQTMSVSGHTENGTWNENNYAFVRAGTCTDGTSQRSEGTALTDVVTYNASDESIRFKVSYRKVRNILTSKLRIAVKLL